jgi:hypothetical protein
MISTTSVPISYRMPNKLRVRGAPELVRLLRNEVDQLMDIGHACVTGKRIATRRQESLIGPQSELIHDVRKRTRAMMYFPRSGGYVSVGMPNNMDRYEGVPSEDIVKLVGSPKACAEARVYLEVRLRPPTRAL